MCKICRSCLHREVCIKFPAMDGSCRYFLEEKKLSDKFVPTCEKCLHFKVCSFHEEYNDINYELCGLFEVR